VWKRFLIGSILMVVASAAATATVAFDELNAITGALKLSPRLDLGGSITPAGSGAPETILLIGSDKRARQAGIDSLSPPHSDTLMLVRLDPRAPATTMLSIPRDLKVRIDLPRGGASVQKINAAYAIGGPRLTVETVKRVIGVQINHVVDVNFRGFRDAVDTLGCVYADVDHRYYNDNSTALPGQGYATIDIQPGYQKLCGQDALDYVRYRHTDTDIVRAARQQDFLRQAKQQLAVSDLIGNRRTLERIFGRYAQTDIRGVKQVVEAIQLLVSSAGRPVVRIPFPARLGPSYVYADRSRIRGAVYAFLHGGRGLGRGAAAATPRRAHRRGRHTRPRSDPALVPASSADLSQAQTGAAQARLPFWFPRREVKFGPATATVRDYRLPDAHGHRHAAYRVVVPTGIAGDYWGLQGTTWTDPPIVAAPHDTMRLAGRDVQLFYDGQHLRFVAWRAGPALYWVSNTLTDALTNDEMLGVARSAAPLHG
jgi:polyisoprenyl-teichoic acid--peptidoglycan teichoic acid transferase